MNSYKRLYNLLTEAKRRRWEIDSEPETDDEKADRIEREGAEDARGEFNPGTIEGDTRRSVKIGKTRATKAKHAARSKGWVPWKHRSDAMKVAAIEALKSKDAGK